MNSDPCQRCGQPLPDRARFCPNCGAPVVSPAQERKLVSIVFADLTESTRLAARLDAERFREVLAAFYGIVTDEITALRGRTEQYIGDAVMGVFGVPAAHDDDATRAIRAGLAIVQGSLRLEVELGLPVRVRVGVNTGPVAVGSGSGPALVSGAEVNMAARLQQAAEPGEVLVGATTHVLARDDVEFGPERGIAAKGYDEAVPAWPALKLAARGTRKSIPLVDRRRELALLSDTFERVVERERAHLVTLLGEPGIGKSRVVDEFLAGLPEGTKVMTGRSSPFEEEVTFWPVAQMVLSEIGVPPDMQSDELAARIGRLADELVEPDEAERAAYRLGLALGLGEEGNEENRYHAAEVRAGVLTLISGLAASGPVVMVFEDLHEADPLLLDLIEEVVKEARRMPLLVVCVAREFLVDRPGWGGAIADAVTLWVEPLAPSEAAQLAREAGDLEQDQSERVAAHAGGNPLFIIEITGMMLHEEVNLPPRGPATAQILPPTVQAVVAARIDHLSSPARELVRRASVFARGVFDLSELELIAEPDKEALEELELEELLVRDEERPTVWRFRSDVLRDVAYESLAKRERQRLHLRVANKLGAHRYPRSVAYHLEQAARAALDLNPRDRTVAERAVEALAHAGDLARRKVESRASADLYERALALAGPEDRWGSPEATILSGLGEARYWLGEFDQAEIALSRALELAGDTDTFILAHASRFLADITLTIRGEVDAAEKLFDRALEAAREMQDPRTLSRTLLMAGWVPYWRSDLAGARAMFQEALEVARSGGRDAWSEARALVGLAVITSPEGDEEEALALAQQARALGEASNQAFTTAVAQQTVASSLRRMLRLDEALEQAEAAVRTLRGLGSRWELASALGDRGEIHRLAGRHDDAERDLREAFRLCRDLGERALVTWTAAELARNLIAKGDLAGARQVLDDPDSRGASKDPGSIAALLTAGATLAYVEGEREMALEKALAALDAQRNEGEGGNALAAQVWWTASLFGHEAAGGADDVRAARARLETHGWRQALHEPEIVLSLA